jgi:DnaJ-class molecular chaperone
MEKVKYQTCPRCNGSGTLRLATVDTQSSPLIVAQGQTAHGRIVVIEQPCPDCAGRGFVEKKEGK